MTEKIRIGTRGSPLALAQAHETRERLSKAHGLDEAQFDIVVISTAGDRILNQPLAEIGGKGLFTLEIETALREGAIDLAVHSLKDMPTAMPDDLALRAILPREDVRDAFISLSVKSLRDMPQGAVLGSSSVRRTAQALRIRPDLQPVQFRGNVQTRLRKLQEGVAAATFLAAAGLKRLGLTQHISSYIEIDDMLPAVAQGAICIEVATNNKKMTSIVKAINHEMTNQAVSCERAFLAVLDGSCRTPIAGHASIGNGKLTFRGQVLSLDGMSEINCRAEGLVDDAVTIGKEAGQKLLQQLPDLARKA
jgi:hydroxymethylbilane synthase